MALGSSIALLQSLAAPAFAGSGPALKPPEPTERYALVVGVNDYADPAMPDLEFAAEDAKAVEQALLQSLSFLPEHVRRLSSDRDLDHRPTYANIRRELDDIEALGKANHRPQLVFIYFSGHGLGVSEGDTNTNALLPEGATRDAQGRWLADAEHDLLSVEDLVLASERSGAQQRVVVLDACRNLNARATAPLAPFEVPATSVTEQGTLVLYSAQFGSVSFEERQLRRGRFTGYLERGLRGEADGYVLGGGWLPEDGLVTVNELYGWVHDQMVARGGRGEPVQVPYRAGEVAGDYAMVWTPRPCVGGEVELTTALREASLSTRTPGWPGFDLAFESASCHLIGLNETMSPTTAAMWHRSQALRYFRLHEDSAALLALTSAFATDEQGDVRVGLPDGPPALIELASQAQVRARGEVPSTTSLPRVPGGYYEVNGRRSKVLPTGRPSVVQGVWVNGQVQWTMEADSVASLRQLPAAPTSVRFIPVEKGLLLAAGSAGIVGAMLGTDAWVKAEKIRTWGPMIEDTAPEDLPFTEDEFNTLIYRQAAARNVAAAMGGAVVTLGLTSLTLKVWLGE